MSQPASKTPWYADGVQFTCTQCGNCCSGAPGYVWVSAAEREALAALLGLDPASFMTRYSRRVRGAYSLNELPNGDCVFLETVEGGKRRCGVYAARPLQCRTWPFWDSNIESREDWNAAGRGCPGINKGMHHPLPVIDQALRMNAAAGLSL